MITGSNRLAEDTVIRSYVLRRVTEGKGRSCHRALILGPRQSYKGGSQ